MLKELETNFSLLEKKIDEVRKTKKSFRKVCNSG
jgi:hypothetical protein